MQTAATGIFWYRSAEDYRDMLAIFTDADELPGTYGDWLAQAEHVEQIAFGDGLNPIRAYAVPRDFAEWCHAHHTHVDAHGRREFANWFAAKSVLGTELT